MDEPLPPKPKIIAGTDITDPPADPPAAAADRLFSDNTETELDEAFAEEEARLDGDDPAGFDADPTDAAHDHDDALDHHLISRRERDLARRQKKHASRLPLARFRRFARMTGLIMLMTLVGMAYQFRIDIVRAFPDLGGLYQTIGLPVNIYGLTFSNAETLRTLKDGDDVTIISAKIRNVVNRTVRIPPILVSILNADDTPIYEWTAHAPVEIVSPGEIIDFQTQLNSAPADAAKVRLVFGGTAMEQAGP